MTTERLAWLEARRAGIGGSDVAALANLHPYRSAWEVYWDKVLPVSDGYAGEAARWGQLLEGAVADEWVRRARSRLLEVPGLIVDPAHPWRRGTPDRLIHELEEVVPGFAPWGAPRRLDGVLEVKLADWGAWEHHWDGGAIVPRWYQAQGQWYAGLADADRIVFAVLVSGRRLEEFELERDDAAIDALRRIADTFWHEHVLKRVPPQPGGRRSTRDALDAFYPVPDDGVAACRLPGAAADLVDDYRAAGLEVKAWTERQQEAANRLIDLLGQAGATDGYLPGDDDDAAPAVTYRPVRAVDWAALEEEVGADALDPYRKASIDTKAAEKGLGRKVLDAHRKLTQQRRIRVRPD